MKRRAPSCHGAPFPERGFTLLELCIVLLIIAILLGAMVPSIQSAFVESAMRADARQISLTVRTAMLKSTDENQDYVIDLTSKSVDLHAAQAKEANDESDQPQALNEANKLLVPDPKKVDGWMTIPDTSWLFRPGALCPATRVRLARGKAWLEMSFNALTGNVEDERTYFP